jgi:hypothetical protein
MDKVKSKAKELIKDLNLNKKSVREQLKNSLATFEAIREFVKAFDFTQLDNGVSVEMWSSSVAFRVTTLGQLRSVRKAFRQHFAKYSDKVSSIYHSQGTKGTASFNVFSDGKKVEFIYLLLTAEIENFPIKPGKDCGFRKITKVKEEYEYSCAAQQ